MTIDDVNRSSALFVSKLKRVVISIVLVVLMVMAAVTYYLIMSDRKSILENTGRTIQSTAVAINKEADVTLAFTSAALQRLLLQIEFTDQGELKTPFKVHQLLVSERKISNESVGLNSFGHLFILNNRGYNLVNSVSYPVKRVDASDRNYFVHHKSFNDLKMRVSRPIVSKVTGERVIYLTRRVSDNHGQFLGVIGFQLKLSHFDTLYSQLSIPAGGTVTMVRADGWGIYRYPMVDSFFERSIGQYGRFQQLLISKMGFFTSEKSPYDNAVRLVGYKLSDRYPILNMVTLTESEILRPWWDKSLKIIAVALLAMGGIISLAFFSCRQLSNLQRERVLSSHDPLTSLLNRREFDERFQNEWRRAKRKEYSISVVFIDVDYFKNYNDCYGHRKGDRCLQLIAQQIETSFRRSGELVARYGGEEFIVVLPQLEKNEVVQLAEKLIVAIEQLAMPHIRSEISEVVTVSAGVVTLIPEVGMESSVLIDLADEALYKAKKAGRNRIAVTE